MAGNSMQMRKDSAIEHDGVVQSLLPEIDIVQHCGQARNKAFKGNIYITQPTDNIT